MVPIPAKSDYPTRKTPAKVPTPSATNTKIPSSKFSPLGGAKTPASKSSSGGKQLPVLGGQKAPKAPTVPTTGVNPKGDTDRPSRNRLTP